MLIKAMSLFHKEIFWLSVHWNWKNLPEQQMDQLDLRKVLNKGDYTDFCKNNDNYDYFLIDE